jgi:hypothetical protein
LSDISIPDVPPPPPRRAPRFVWERERAPRRIDELLIPPLDRALRGATVARLVFVPLQPPYGEAGLAVTVGATPRGRILTAKRTGEWDGPGVARSRYMANEEWSALWSAIDNAGIETMPTDDPRDPPADGQLYQIELVRRGRYHKVTRPGLDPGSPLFAVYCSLIELAGHDLVEASDGTLNAYGRHLQCDR